MKKIALIEDDTDLYNLVQYNLDKEGFQVVGSQTGKGALDLCRRERPDLIILDIMLPMGSGQDLCAQVRQSGVTTPVLFLTAHASSQDVVHAFASGADDYVVKPFRAPELGARIFGLLRRARMTAPGT